MLNGLYLLGLNTISKTSQEFTIWKAIKETKESCFSIAAYL